MSRALPDGRNLINLCEHRDSFLIASCAALVRGHTNLLPSSRADGVVDEVAALNPAAIAAMTNSSAPLASERKGSR